RKHSAKLMPCFQGPFAVLEVFPDTSTYKLALPPSDKMHPMFHASKLKCYVENNEEVFPGRRF
ncbi:hypothetical protein BDV93DRAFT_417806, partial [Ceratobasidium sp. AG-I]